MTHEPPNHPPAPEQEDSGVLPDTIPRGQPETRNPVDAEAPHPLIRLSYDVREATLRYSVAGTVPLGEVNERGERRSPDRAFERVLIQVWDGAS